MDILYEDNHLLAVNKPAGIATMGAPSDTETMVTRVKRYIRHEYRKSGNVYLGVVSRLDKPATGVLLFARTSKAAARLTRLFQKRDVRKRYWVLVTPSREMNAQGQLEHWLRKNEAQRRMEVCSRESPGCQLAQLTYRVRRRAAGRVWLDVELHTGRKHQIRVQLADNGFPVVGDKKYGSRDVFERGIALHARQLEFVHPVRQSPIRLVAPLPSYWPPIVK